MILDNLEVLFDHLDVDGPTNSQLEELYRLYLDDVCNIVFKDEILKVNTNKTRNPICKGKPQTFEHLITRKSKYSGKRCFDRDRANRIHWIKPVIENYKDARIKHFTEYNHKNELQFFFFYEEKDFIIIIRELSNGLMIVTAYYVDEGRKRGIRKKYFAYKEKNPTS